MDGPRHLAALVIEKITGRMARRKSARAKDGTRETGRKRSGQHQKAQHVDSKAGEVTHGQAQTTPTKAPTASTGATPGTPPRASDSPRPVLESQESSHEYTATGLDDSPRKPFRARHRKPPSTQRHSKNMDGTTDATAGPPPTFGTVAVNGQTQHDSEFPALQPTNGSTGDANGQEAEQEAPTYAKVAKAEDATSTASTSSTAVNGNSSSGRGGRLDDPFTDAPPPRARNGGEKPQPPEKSPSRKAKSSIGEPLDGQAGGASGSGERDKMRTVQAGGIRFAPWHVPLQRRLQTLAVLWHSITIGLCLALFWFLCAMPLAWPLLLLYLVRLVFSHDGSDGSLHRRSQRLRSWWVWRSFADYFPARLHKTADLLPTRKYILGYHPHGIISHGAWVAFGTEALGFSELFPGITNTLVTLESNFRTPIYRDYVLAMGLQSVSKESITNILTKGGRNGEGMGRAVTIVVGGARESLSAQPGTMRLVLQSRKGFVKLALRTGSDLVPVIAFGENDLYKQLTAEGHPRLHQLQMWILRVAKFTLPFLHGRGIFNYDVGLMPYRRPLNVVVGRPIPVQQAVVPGELDPAEVDRLHALYCEQLVDLWNRYKDEFAPDRTSEIEFTS